MKKYILGLLVLGSLFASAQLTPAVGPYLIPRTGNVTTPYRDNTYRALSQRFLVQPLILAG